MALGVGEEFAGYTVLGELGMGGMGEVYLVQHPRLPRKEAIKILRPDISTDPSFRQRFTREADAIATLDHPHIVTVYDRGNTNGQLWIATQYIDGIDAAQLLAHRYPDGMPTDEVADITTAVAAALDYAHNQGILHRDVKPANVLLTRPDHDGNRRTYLTDFGIARTLSDPAGLTTTGFTVGTFAYAAPEQLMGRDLDGRADQYALAATAYHLLTGRPVYCDSNPVAVISQHLAEPSPPPSTVRPELAAFDAVFTRALAKKAEDRFPSCRDFAAALAAAAARSGGTYPPSAPTQAASMPVVTKTDAKTIPPTKRIALAGLSILLVGAGGALLWHTRNASQQPLSGAAPSAPTLTTVSAPTSTTTVTIGPTVTTVPTTIKQPAPPAPKETTFPTAATSAEQPNESAFLSAMGSVPMYVHLNRYGGDADLLSQGYKACAALDKNPNPLRAAYVLYPSGNDVYGQITDDGMNVMRYSAMYLCPRNAHLFFG